MAVLLKTASVRVSSIQIIQVRVQNKGNSVWKSRYDGEVSHAKESPIRTRAEVLSLVSSCFNSPDDVYSPAVRIPPNPGLP